MRWRRARAQPPGLLMGCADIATVLWRDVPTSTRPIPIGRSLDDLSCRAAMAACSCTACFISRASVVLKDWASTRHQAVPSGRLKDAWAPRISVRSGCSPRDPLSRSSARGLRPRSAWRLPRRPSSVRSPNSLTTTPTSSSSDGDLMGVSQEAIGIAGHLKLKKLIVFWSTIGFALMGRSRSSPTTSHEDFVRFQSAGWN